MGLYRNHLVSEVIQYTEKQSRIIKGAVPGVQRGRTRRPRASSSQPSARRSCSSCSPRSKSYYHSDFLNRYFLNRYEEGKKNIKEQESNNTIIPSMWPSPYSQHMAIPLCISFHIQLYSCFYILEISLSCLYVIQNISLDSFQFRLVQSLIKNAII